MGDVGMMGYHVNGDPEHNSERDKIPRSTIVGQRFLWMRSTPARRSFNWSIGYRFTSRILTLVLQQSSRTGPPSLRSVVAGECNRC